MTSCHDERDDRRRRQVASFGAAADAYERARPTYPDAAVAWMLEHDVARALDLGAGTGKLTRALVARGVATVAVDPSAAMLARLRAAVPQAAIHIGSAEAIPLPDASVDAIVMGQAWHWVDPPRAVPEIARVLRPGGTLAMVWNVRDADAAWMARFSRIVDRGDHTQGYRGPPSVGAPFGPIEHFTTSWTYELTEAGIVDLALSRSTAIVASAEERAEMTRDLRALFSQVSAGSATMTMPYVTHAFRATLLDR